MRVEYEICSTICGTPVQAISDHKDLTKLAWGVRKGQNLPLNDLNLAFEPSRSPQIGQWTLKWTQMVPPTAPDWFESISWAFKALQPLYIKKHQLSYNVKRTDSEILTLPANCGQLRHFLNGFVIPNPKSSKNYPYLISIFDLPPKKMFSSPKGTISAKSAKSEKCVRLCYPACMDLPRKY